MRQSISKVIASMMIVILILTSFQLLVFANPEGGLDDRDNRGDGERRTGTVGKRQP